MYSIPKFISRRQKLFPRKSESKETPPSYRRKLMQVDIMQDLV